MGDKACWLEQTCISCGHMLERRMLERHARDTCPNCGRRHDGVRSASIPGGPDLGAPGAVESGDAD